MIDFKEKVINNLIEEALEEKALEKRKESRDIIEFQEINETTPLIAEKILSVVLSSFENQFGDKKYIELHINFNWRKNSDKPNKAIFGLQAFNDDISVDNYSDFFGKLYSPEMLKDILVEQGLFVQSDLSFKERYEFDAQREDYSLIVFFSKKMGQQLLLSKLG